MAFVFSDRRPLLENRIVALHTLVQQSLDRIRAIGYLGFAHLPVDEALKKFATGASALPRGPEMAQVEIFLTPIDGGETSVTQTAQPSACTTPEA